MSDFLLYVKVSCALLVGVIIKVLGGWDVMLEVMLTLSILDVITGIVLAIANKKLSSNIAFKGIAKKIGMYILIAASYQTGKVLGYDDLRGIVIGFFIATEMISIIENWGGFDLPLPKKLKDILGELKEK